MLLMQKKTDFVYTDKNALETYIKNQYKEYSNVTLSENSGKKLNSKNYSNQDFILYYNSTNDKGVLIGDEGLCWAVSMTSLLEYYGCGKSAYEISSNVLDIAIEKKYWYPDKNDVYDTEVDDLLDDIFDSYGGKYKNYDVNNDTFDLYNTIKKEVNSNRVSLLLIPEHAMVACGYQPYTVKYKYKTWYGSTKSKSVTENVVVVNDTWANNSKRQYSYYPEDKILTGIFDRLYFTVTKIIK